MRSSMWREASNNGGWGRRIFPGATLNLDIKVYIIYIIRRHIKPIVPESPLWYGVPMQTATPSPEKRIYTVTELTQSIKALLESKYPFVWVTGEISNLRVPGSGHFYFTLKDSGAQISAVMFRAQNKNLRFLPDDGMAVIALG